MTIEEYKQKKVGMTQKIRDVLTYVGTATAIIFGAVYIAVLLVLILGFESNIDGSQQLLFVGLGAAAGLVIDISLMSQGIALAKRSEECEGIMKKYYEAKNKAIKKNRHRTINSYVVSHVITTLFTKVLFGAASIYLIVHFVIVGSQDMTLLLLGMANLLMFAGFGTMSLAKAYDYYLEQHIPAIIAKTEQLNRPVGVHTDEKESSHAYVQ